MALTGRQNFGRHEISTQQIPTINLNNTLRNSLIAFGTIGAIGVTAAMIYYSVQAFAKGNQPQLPKQDPEAALVVPPQDLENHSAPAGIDDGIGEPKEPISSPAPQTPTDVVKVTPEEIDKATRFPIDETPVAKEKYEPFDVLAKVFDSAVNKTDGEGFKSLVERFKGAFSLVEQKDIESLDPITLYLFDPDSGRFFFDLTPKERADLMAKYPQIQVYEFAAKGDAGGSADLYESNFMAEFLKIIVSNGGSCMYYSSDDFTKVDNGEYDDFDFFIGNGLAERGGFTFLGMSRFRNFNYRKASEFLESLYFQKYAIAIYNESTGKYEEISLKEAEEKTKKVSQDAGEGFGYKIIQSQE